MLTPGLRRFLSDDEREEWGELASKVTRWTALGCDTTAQASERLGAEVARWCYARGSGAEGGRVLIMAFTGDWRLAAADWYGY